MNLLDMRNTVEENLYAVILYAKKMNFLAEILCEYMTKGRMIGIEGKIKVDKYKNENGENRYITRVRATSFKFLDYKNKSLDALAVKEVEDDYYDSNSLFKEVNSIDEISIEKLPF